MQGLTGYLMFGILALLLVFLYQRTLAGRL